MTKQRSFEILELKQNATMEDARQAYKDIVTVWHPDRFASNPRLKERAEQKLKEINVAYETVQTVFQQGSSSKIHSEEEPDSFYRQAYGGDDINGERTSKVRTRTEIAAEMGTTLILGFYSFISARLQRFLENDPP